MNIVEYVNSTFGHFNPEFRQELIKHGKIMRIKAGDTLMTIGGEFKMIPLLVDGAIKVLREDEEGNELFLYFLRPGQTCALSLNCFMLAQPSEVHAEAEEDTIIIGLQPDYVRNWMDAYPDWRNFVMQTFQQRFHELLLTIDSIAFKKLDERLLAYLHEKADVNHNRVINTTHQEIAYELNSTREVISRLLKILEKQGAIELGRNKIVVM